MAAEASIGFVTYFFSSCLVFRVFNSRVWFSSYMLFTVSMLCFVLPLSFTKAKKLQIDFDCFKVKF